MSNKQPQAPPQIKTFNPQVIGVNTPRTDLEKKMSQVIQNMNRRINALQSENAQLKAKLGQTQQTQK